MERSDLREIGVRKVSLLPCRQDEIHIAFAIDGHYVQHMGVAMTSLAVNNPAINFHFHIVFDEMSEDDGVRLTKLCQIYQLSAHFYQVANPSLFDNLKTRFHISKATYYRFLLPYLLPTELERVIFLDADLVCHGDIKGLWQISLDKAPLAAMVVKAYPDQIVRMGLKRGLYLNAGVLVLNLPVWRQDNISQRLIDYMLTFPEKIDWLDQDAIAIVLEGQIVPFNERFNTTIDCVTGDGTITDSTVIIHYTGSCKPWHQWCPDDRKQFYWQYLKMSPWFDAKPQAPATVLQVLCAMKLENGYGHSMEVNDLINELINRIMNK